MKRLNKSKWVQFIIINIGINSNLEMVLMRYYEKGNQITLSTT